MPRKVDQNQASLVMVLRRAGATVTSTHEVGRGFPDLAVGCRGLTLVGDFDRAEVLRRLAGVEGLTVHQGTNLLVEVKNPAYKARMTPAERHWHARWRGQKAVVETARDVLRLLGKK
jgi:hypothetical protein